MDQYAISNTILKAYCGKLLPTIKKCNKVIFVKIRSNVVDIYSFLLFFALLFHVLQKVISAVLTSKRAEKSKIGMDNGKTPAKNFWKKKQHLKKKTQKVSKFQSKYNTLIFYELYLFYAFLKQMFLSNWMLKYVLVISLLN